MESLTRPPTLKKNWKTYVFYLKIFQLEYFYQIPKKGGKYKYKYKSPYVKKKILLFFFETLPNIIDLILVS